MLERSIRRKLESLRDLPTIPTVIAQVLKALDDTNMRASTLAALIERDQTLTSRVLSVANSPFYGFQRRISTLDLAIVIMGLNSIKEIVISLIVQRFFSRVNKNIIDIKSFWEYSVFCGACSRLLARKMGYKLAGEAFVAGLMHDLGLIIMIEYFTPSFREIRRIQKSRGITLLHAEKLVMVSTHCDIGAWLAEKWNLPAQLCDAIRFHHTPYFKLEEEVNSQNESQKPIDSINQQLTAIVSMSEWMAFEMGYKEWSFEKEQPEFYLADEIFGDISGNEMMDSKSTIELLKQEIAEEYSRASSFTQVPTVPLY